MISRSKYLYATGRIRSLETKLLDANDLERMIDAKDARTAFKVFNDLSYADELSEVESAKEYKSALDHDLMQVKKILRQISPDEEILELLFSAYDFHNIKLFFKSKYLEKDLSSYESHLGNVDVANLKDFIIKDAKTSIPDKISEVVKEASKLFEKEKSGFIIDSYLDREYLKKIEEISKKIGNKFIIKLAKTWIDLANVKIFLRAKKLELPLEKIAEYFVEGGSTLKSSLVNSYDKDLKEAAVICIRGFEDNQIKEAIKNYSEGEELWRLEKAFENFEIKFIRQAKYIAYGPEVVVAYYLAKQNAIKNIRLVFTGKVNGLSSDKIKERVREIY